jgi:surfeit locus 1 family protein
MPAASKRYTFKPAVLPTLAAAITAGLLIGLGMWQLNRAQEKEVMLLQYEARSQEPPIQLRLPVRNRSAWRYCHVRMEGRFVDDHQFLLDNQVKQGEAGYHVFTPFTPSQDRLSVLVDRGWIPLGDSREKLPDVTVPSGKTRLNGLVYLPYEKAFSLGGMATGETGWPLRVQFIDFEQMEKRLERPLARLIIRLDPRSPHGYRREWQVVPFGPERHLGYAAQWFALAVAVLVIYVAVNLTRIAKE